MRKVVKVLLMASCIVWVSGCKKENTETASNVTAEQVQKETTEAVEAAGTYMDQQKEALVEKAGQAFSQLQTDTETLISDLKASGQQAWQDLAVELDSKLQAAQEKFNDLKETDNFQTAKAAFDAAVNELKQAYEKARAQMQNKATE